jgi:hypothetical protein
MLSEPLGGGFMQDQYAADLAMWLRRAALALEEIRDMLKLIQQSQQGQDKASR